MPIKKWMKSPKGYVVIALVAFLLIASIGSKNTMGIKNAIIAVGFSVALDMICSLMAKRKKITPTGAVITGLIISLILGVTTAWPIIVATAALSILSKHLLVYKKKPIFNPAAFGLLLSSVIFQTGQSWWGAFGDLPAWTLILVLIGGYAVANRVKKYPQVLSFLGTLFVLLFLMAHFNIGDATDALRTPYINSSLFFAFFMLTDPPTSPAKAKGQIIFGLLTAVAGTVIYGLFGGLIYLFIGLLLGNLYHFLKARSASQASKAARPAVNKPLKASVR
ncbi:RnfABCDGE type electron transport complex subunit D [Paenibacillus sp. 19GGS1-52]|uniref:RnfABCDGE type electron transport complex subunit D n=1 Tax=Paenibacillus sp. 19GGS1-52 TaxID=2758563 RepID=UPI001EFBAD2E|nr:RnfABCDGE type electron transport complex subunit D [Paenibacillus sp. 19GGS1-52]ULO07371.1 RnfABCDGE type electron transport complex subunit D [Paenibacillus sp. 19GGS1-52]